MILAWEHSVVFKSNELLQIVVDFITNLIGLWLIKCSLTHIAPPLTHQITRQPGNQAPGHPGTFSLFLRGNGATLSLSHSDSSSSFFFFLSQKDNYGWIMLTFQSKFTKATHSHPYLIRNLTIGLVKQLKFG